MQGPVVTSATILYSEERYSDLEGCIAGRRVQCRERMLGNLIRLYVNIIFYRQIVPIDPVIQLMTLEQSAFRTKSKTLRFGFPESKTQKKSEDALSLGGYRDRFSLIALS